MADTENVTTKFKVDISDLKKNVAEANRQIKTYKAEIKNASAGMDKGEESIDSLSKKIEAQSKVVDAEKAKLDALKQQLEKYNAKIAEGETVISDLTQKHNEAKQAYGENSEEVKALAKQLKDAQAAQERNKTAVQQLNIQIINQDTAVKNAEAALGTYQNKLKDVTGQNDTLTDKVKKQETELQELKQKYINVSAEQGATSDESKELARQIDALSIELKDNKTKLSEVEKAADEFDHSLEDVDEEVKSTTNGGLDAFAVALGNLAAKAITAVISKLGELADSVKEAYLQFDEGRDAVVKATGATGKTAKEMTKSYANVAKSVVGDFATIGGALGEVNTRFGYTDEELEKATEQFLKFADITSSDAVTAVQLVSRAMGDAGIDSSEYSAVLDQLAIATQASGISVNKLTENLTKYGAPMRALGFDTKESISVFSQWEKAGVNTEIAFSGMKTAIANWSAEGKNAKVEFKNTLDEIASAPDIAAATTKAIETFGKKAGPDLADAIQAGRFEYSEFLNLLENSEGTVTKTYEETQSGADKAKLAIQQLKTTAAEIVNDFLEKHEPEIESAIEKIEKIIEKLAPKIEKGIQWLVDNLSIITAGVIGIATAFATWKFVGLITAVTTALKGMTIAEMAAAAKTWLLNTALLANPIGLLISLLAGLVAAFVVLWNKCDWFREFWINLWEKIKSVAEPIIEKIKDFFVDLWQNAQPILQQLKDAFHEIWDSLKDLFSDIWAVVKPGIDNIKEGFAAIWEAAQPIIKKVKQFFKNTWKTIQPIIENVRDIIGDAIERIKGWFKLLSDTVSPMIEKIKDIILNVISEVKEMLSASWGAIKAVWDFVQPYLVAILEKIKAIFLPIAEVLGKYFLAAWEIIKVVWDIVVQYFQLIWNNIKTIFSAVGHTLGAFFKSAWDNIKVVWDLVVGYFKMIWDNIKLIFSVVESVFKGDFSGAWEAITAIWNNVKGYFQKVWNGIKEIFSNTVAFFKTAFSDAWEAIKGVFKNVGKFFGGIWDTIKENFSTIGTKVGDAIGSTFKLAINAIIATVEDTINWIPKALNRAIDKINELPGVDLSPMPTVELPRLMAKGGIVKRATNTVIGEDGAEAVIPLEKNTGGLKRIAQMLAAELKPQLKIGSSGNSYNNRQQIVNNYNFNQTNNSPEALSRYEIYRQSKNLLQSIKAVNS